MTPPLPPARPPRAPASPPPAPPPPPPIAPQDPGVPWGPIRIKRHGRYLQPEAASLLFAAGLLLAILVVFACWRLARTLSRPQPTLQPAPIVNRFPPQQPRKALRHSRIKKTPDGPADAPIAPPNDPPPPGH